MTQILSHEGSIDSSSSPDDCTRSALTFAHQLLVDSGAERMSWEDRLKNLAGAFQAEGAGLAGLLDGTSIVRHHVSGDGKPGQCRPWELTPQLLIQTQATASALPVRGADGRSYLLTIPCHQDGARWLFWLEAPAERAWTTGERAALTVAALALARFIAAEVEGGDWARWLERARLQQRLEDMTLVVGRLSHDFGNVLTGIMGFTELGLAQLAPESVAFSRIQEVYTAAQRGVELIGRLNQFSQRTPKHWRPSALAEVVEEEAARRRAAWGPKIALNVTVAADLPPVTLDVASLRHLLSTLLDNARQAILVDGTVTVAAELATMTVQECFDLLGNPTPGAAVLLSVQDTGIGFSPEARRRVFTEPFFSSKPRHRGMGLLTLYGILRMFGGGLRLEHGREGGTRVLAYLPVASPAPSPPRAESGTGSGREGGQVLVVEDDPMMRRFVKATLEQAGFEVHLACDGVEALGLYRAEPGACRLVLADLIMPRMGGLELARRLVERDPGVQILFTSGHVPTGFDQESFGGRQFALLTKPFSPDGLVRAARATLGISV